MPVFLISSILLAIFLAFRLKKNARVENSSTEDFWSREYNANFVRPKDISNLDYIQIALSDLPFDENATGELLEVQNSICDLSKKKLLNLSSQSNTDLKYAYGAQNLEFLMCSDQNYALFLRNLNKWAVLLYKETRVVEAKAILEYAISLKTDISTSFSLLAKIYAEEGVPEKIRLLLTQAESLDSLMKDSLIKTLTAYL